MSGPGWSGSRDERDRDERDRDGRAGMSGAGMSGTGDIRVVVADDQALVRAGLATLLDSQPGLTVVGQAGDGEQAVRLAREAQPDVVLMDVRMPRLDGRPPPAVSPANSLPKYLPPRPRGHPDHLRPG